MFILKLLYRARKLLLSLLILAALLVGLYWLLFDRIGAIHPNAEEQRLLLIGRVTQTYARDARLETAAYVLRDPTGSIWCLSEKGPPRAGSLLILWGHSERTTQGRTVCREDGRIGSF